MLDLALDKRIFLNTELDCALQEIDLILNTENTELLGNTSYGTEFEYFLWSLTPSADEIERYIKEKLQDGYYINMFEKHVTCNFYNGNYRNIYEISIEIVDPTTKQVGVRKYRYQ